MNDEPCRQPCRNEPRCDICEELFHAVAPCLDCRERGIHHYVNMLDDIYGDGTLRGSGL